MDTTITIRIQKEVLERFKKVCKDKGISYSEMIRLLIRNCVLEEDLTLRIW